ncbi:MAG: hypothetical protein OEV37_00290 [Candidatus Berkelbacteria bacterium]|nr:hypothetical protein [Candidatus Berkelbacteria bacterium]
MEILSEKEKKVLSGLYELSRATVWDLSKEVGINRTTLYPILEKLLERGLVSKLSVEGHTVYEPILYKDFKRWISRERKKAKDAANDLLRWVDAQEKNSAPALLSDFKYFEGHGGVEALYADSWRENKGKIIYCITDYKAALTTMGDFFNNEYFPDRVSRGVCVKNLVPESALGRSELKRKKELLREVKFIDIFEDLGIEVNIYDDKISIVAYDKKLPSGVLIKNAKIAEALRKIFEYLWRENKRS